METWVNILYSAIIKSFSDKYINSSNKSGHGAQLIKTFFSCIYVKQFTTQLFNKKQLVKDGLEEFRNT